ncbi:MAG: hypothetical protein GXY86_08625 [Firmicutes bacterium]|nr:hypothetical protein [Bacillota bacterium]
MKRIAYIIFALMFFSLLITNSYSSEKLFENKFDALKVDPKQEYWKVIFTFGPGGDNEVPYLLQYIDDENRNIRFNSIVMLGKWFLSYDSKEQLIIQYWKETDSQIKLLILSSLEMLITNLSESKEFFNSVIQNEADPKARDFALESLNMLDDLPSMIDEFKKDKEIDSKKFKKEYKKIYKSYGTEGSYKRLYEYSSFANESDLKSLKIRILKRYSDEALYDYDKINDIIMKNRFIKDKQEI